MQTKPPMIIKPLIGVGDITLGLSKEALFELLGQPESANSDEWPDGTISESWIYPATGIVLNFDSDTNYRLSTITIHSKSVELDDINPVGSNIKTLIEKYPTIILDTDPGGDAKDYLDPDKEISFWVVNDMVEHITLFPEYDNLTDEPIWPVGL